MDKMNEVVKINGKEESKEKLQEVRDNLPKNQKLVEVNPGEFKTLTRMKG